MLCSSKWAILFSFSCNLFYVLCFFDWSLLRNSIWVHYFIELCSSLHYISASSPKVHLLNSDNCHCCCQWSPGCTPLTNQCIHWFWFLVDLTIMSHHNKMFAPSTIMLAGHCLVGIAASFVVVYFHLILLGLYFLVPDNSPLPQS
jgi:hypothetical protein